MHCFSFLPCRYRILSIKVGLDNNLQSHWRSFKLTPLQVEFGFPQISNVLSYVKWLCKRDSTGSRAAAWLSSTSRWSPGIMRWEKVSSGMCTARRLWPVCAFARTDCVGMMHLLRNRMLVMDGVDSYVYHQTYFGNVWRIFLLKKLPDQFLWPSYRYLCVNVLFYLLGQV